MIRIIQPIINRPHLGVLAASLGLNLVTWLLAWLAFPTDSQTAILHYSHGIGIDFIGAGSQVYVLPLIGLILLAANATLAQLIRHSSFRAAWMLWGSLPIVEAVLLIALILLWRLNLSPS